MSQARNVNEFVDSRGLVFLSQRDGSELRVFDREGELIQTRCFQSTILMPGAVGGLASPS